MPAPQPHAPRLHAPPPHAPRPHAPRPNALAAHAPAERPSRMRPGCMRPGCMRLSVQTHRGKACSGGVHLRRKADLKAAKDQTCLCGGWGRPWRLTNTTRRLLEGRRQSKHAQRCQWHRGRWGHTKCVPLPLKHASNFRESFCAILTRLGGVGGSGVGGATHSVPCAIFTRPGGGARGGGGCGGVTQSVSPRR
eukprot:253869-Chlamydomonas_euryale.AAC.5